MGMALYDREKAPNILCKELGLATEELLWHWHLQVGECVGRTNVSSHNIESCFKVGLPSSDSGGRFEEF